MIIRIKELTIKIVKIILRWTKRIVLGIGILIVAMIVYGLLNPQTPEQKAAYELKQRQQIELQMENEKKIAAEKKVLADKAEAEAKMTAEEKAARDKADAEKAAAVAKAAEEKAAADKVIADKAAAEKALYEKKAADDAAIVKAAADKGLKYKAWIDAQFSQWDGSNYDLVKLVKANLNDPKSFEHVQTTWKNYGVGTYIEIQMTYRAKNAFGALVLGSVVAKSDYNTDTMTIISSN